MSIQSIGFVSETLKGHQDILEEIGIVWKRVDGLEELALKSFGEDNPISESLGYAAVHMMNTYIEIEKNTKDSVNKLPRELFRDPTEQLSVVQTSKAYTLQELKAVDLGKETRPISLEIEGQATYVRSWTDLCVKFVKWLVDEGILTASQIPILNHAQGEKYFINTERKHLFGEKDAAWKRVGDFFVDTKYNADAHVKNIRSTLRDVGRANVDVKITFR